MRFCYTDSPIVNQTNNNIRGKWIIIVGLIAKQATTLKGFLRAKCTRIVCTGFTPDEGHRGGFLHI